jgi:hypothetical protein
LRKTYIFSDYASPFPQLNDVLEDLNNQVRTRTDAAVLARALDISNLASFLYTILQPDEAARSLGASLLDLEDDEEVEVTRTEKGKMKMDDGDRLSEVKRNVRARNRLLNLAWKRFWLIVVGRERRESEEALNLWLDFATQVSLVIAGYEAGQLSRHRSS